MQMLGQLRLADPMRLQLTAQGVEDVFSGHGVVKIERTRY
jgi:hypothetical protein